MCIEFFPHRFQRQSENMKNRNRTFENCHEIACEVTQLYLTLEFPKEQEETKMFRLKRKLKYSKKIISHLLQFMINLFLLVLRLNLLNR